MIIIVNEKDFIKNSKKLVSPKDYIVGICTKASEVTELTNFAGSVSLTGLTPPPKLTNIIKQFDKKDDVEGIAKLEKLEKAFFKSSSFRNTMLGVMISIVKDGDKNVFLVYSKSHYKYFAKKLKKYINKKYNVEIAFTFKEVADHKGILKDTLSKSDLVDLNEIIKAEEKKLRKINEKEEEGSFSRKKDKKKKKKDKDKKKKKNKKKKYLDF